MTRTLNMLATAGIAPQVGLVVSLTTVLPVLQAISLIVGIAAGLSMLYVTWKRERRHERNADAQQAHNRQFLALHRREHRDLAINAMIADAIVPPPDVRSPLHRP